MAPRSRAGPNPNPNPDPNPNPNPDPNPDLNPIPNPNPRRLGVGLAVGAARQQEHVKSEQLRGDEVAEIVGLEEHDLVMVGVWAWV